MPSTASQVEVQAPPGLENVGSHLMPGTTGAPAGAPGAKSEQELKEELVREVTAACKEHVETRTTAAVENLWQRGQKAIQYMQQQHMAQTEQLQSQLAACAESYRNLERENQVLRSGLEALMKHLTALFGAPPHIPPPSHASSASQSPFFPPSAQASRAPSEYGAQASRAPSEYGTQAFVPPPAPTEAPPAPPAGTPRAVPAPGTMEPEDFHTPISGSPTASVSSTLRTPAAEATEELVSAPPAAPQERSSYSTTTAAAPGLADPSLDAAATASASGGTGSEPPAPVPPSAEPAVVSGFAGGAPPPAPTFTLTLRRADTVPVGLDVQGEDNYLLVERVRPGGAVEAWNRQCPGDLREIRAGDRIIVINGNEDPEAMRQECLTKRLLKMTVQRGASSPAHVPVPNNVYLRAEADEFVPQVGRA